MTEHVSPVLTTGCRCTCGGAELPSSDRGFGSLLDSLLSTSLSPSSRSQGGGLGVGEWFGFLDPLASFQLKQLLQELRTSQELERHAREQIRATAQQADSTKEAPNRFAYAAKPSTSRPVAPLAKRTARPATPATPATTASPAARSSSPTTPEPKKQPQLSGIYFTHPLAAMPPASFPGGAASTSAHNGGSCCPAQI